MFKPEFKEIITKIDKTRKSIHAKQETLKVAHRTWKENDVRLTILSKCFHILSSTKLGLYYMSDSLIYDERNDFWKGFYDTEPELSFAGVAYVEQYNTILRLGLVQFIFSAIESSFRIILQVIKPEACRNGTDSFEGVYNCLLKQLGLKQWINLLDLLRCIRNTIHNNGVYSGKEREINYKGNTYDFKPGGKVKHFSWEFLVGLLDDIEQMIYEVIDHPDVVMKSSIDDPSLSK